MTQRAGKAWRVEPKAVAKKDFRGARLGPGQGTDRMCSAGFQNCKDQGLLCFFHPVLFELKYLFLLHYAWVTFVCWLYAYLKGACNPSL